MNPQEIPPDQPFQTPYSPPPAVPPTAAPSPGTISSGQYLGMPPLPSSAPQPNNGHNPYEFILSSTPHKRSFLSGGSLLKRVAVIAGGLVLVMIIAAILLSALTPGNPVTTHLVSLAEEQQVLIQVSADIRQNASSPSLSAAGITSDMSILSDQQQLLAYLAENKVKLTTAQLSAKPDASTATLLQNAKASNTYDATAVKLLQSLLANYQNHLKSARAVATGPKSIVLLNSAITDANLLATQANAVSL